ncbi:MAG: VTT domain-containing protein [Nitrososphaeraceae archaeon]
MTLFEAIFSIGGSLGYSGVLLVTLLISLIVFVPIPYIPVLIIALLSGRFDPNLLALASATGVTLGRTAIFLASYRGRNLIKKKTLSRMTPLQILLAKYGSLGSFIAALTPIPPDDIIIILLGISKFTPWKFVVTTFFGKLIVNLAVVWMLLLWGRPLAQQILDRTTDPLYLALFAAASISVVGLLLYIVTRLDWGSIIGKRFPWTMNDNQGDKNG